MVFVPIAHDLVHAATVHTAGQAQHFLDEMTKEHRTRRKRLVVDVAVQGLVQSEDKLRHAPKSPSPPQILEHSLSRGTAEVRWAQAARRFDGVTNNQRSVYHPQLGCAAERLLLASF